jgi:lincosamide nucleotidyltransferase A/C/D/E
MDRTEPSSPPLTGEGRDPREPMTARRLISLIETLELEGINVWLDGGWGVDALLGAQTREHDDADFVASVADAQRVIEALASAGYRLVEGDPSAHFVMLDDAGRQVDMHMVQFTPEGGGLYRMESGEMWLYPAYGFAGRGEIIGRPIPCLTPEVQILCHAGYELDEVDLHDIKALRERFGLSEPDAG